MNESGEKVLFCLSSLAAGGIETYLLRFLKARHQCFGKVIVNCKHGYGGALEDDYKRIPGVRISYIRLAYFNISNYIRFYQFLKKEKVDTVCDFTGDFAAGVLCSSRLAGVKRRLVFYRNAQYSFAMTFWKKRYVKGLRYLLTWSATRILSNSQAALDFFYPDWESAENRMQFSVIRNGVLIDGEEEAYACNSYSGLGRQDQKSFVIVSVGNYRRQKNHEGIVEVAARITPVFPQCRFFLIGKGIKEGIEEKVNRKQLGKYFFMPGIKKDVPEALRLMNAFLFPSFLEGQPNALIEAMLLGLPVFASRIPSIIECTPEEVHRNLFPPDDHAAFAAALGDYIKTGKTYDVEKVRRWAKESYNPDKRFDEFKEELIKPII